MRFFRYKSDLPPEMLLERFERFPAREQHSPMKPFDTYYDPRIGLHTYASENGSRGYYEDGSHKKGGDLQSMKVWFDLKVKPHGEGSKVTCIVYSSPYAIMLFVFMMFSAIYHSFTDPMSGGIIMGFALFFLFLENMGQSQVKEQILTLAPPKTKPKPKNKKI